MHIIISVLYLLFFEVLKNKNKNSDGEELRATTYSRCGLIAMTTYRRFCCNDLLRFGPLNLQMHSTNGMDFYLTHLSLWPANCHVADTPGGRITGYILGSVEGMDVQRVGQLSVLSLPYKDLRHLVEELSNLLEDSCDKIYKVYTMKMLVHAERTEIIREFEKLGYRIYREHGEYLEYRKPLPLLVALAREDG